MTLYAVTAHVRNLDDYGGQRSRFLIAAAQTAGFKVLTFVPDVDSLSGAKLPRSKEDRGIVRVECPTFKRKASGRQPITRLWSQIVFAASVCHRLLSLRASEGVTLLNNNPIVAYFVVGVFLRLRRHRYVLDQRDVPWDVVRKRRPVFGWLLTRLHRFVYGGAMGSLTVSASMATRLSEGMQDLKIESVVPLGSDKPLSPARLEHKFSPRTASLVYVGSLNNYFSLKGICRELADQGFDGTLDYFGANQSACPEFEFLNYRGVLNKSQLQQVLCGYDAGLFPTIDTEFTYYLLGNKVFDYLSAGIPVITSCETGATDGFELVQMSRRLGFGAGFEQVDWGSDALVSFQSEDLSELSRECIDRDLLQFFSLLEASCSVRRG